MPSSKKNEPKFLSFISGNKINTFKKKIRGDEIEHCPIKTLNQLLNPSLAVPKMNVSLRSLRSKPSQPPSRFHQQLLHPDHLSNSDRTENCSRETIGESVNQVSSDLSRNVVAEPSRNESVFAVPTMRAPKAVKIDPSYWIDQIKKKALISWCTFDEVTFKKLITLLNVYILKVVEESGPEPSDIRDDYQNSHLQTLTDWFQTFGETTSVAGSVISSRNYIPGPGIRDIENMSSVSGYQPVYQNSFVKNYQREMDCRSSVGSEMLPAFCKPHNETGVGYRDFSSTYDEENQFRYRPNLSMRPYLPSDNGLPKISYMGRPCEGSVVGSSFQPSFMQRHQPMMDNRPLKSSYMGRPNEGSVIGSTFQTRSDICGNQPSFMQRNQQMMGYPSRGLSTRLDGSFVRPYPNSDMCSNCSVILPKHHAYSQINQMPQMNGNSTRMYDGRRASSVVGGLGEVHFDNAGKNLLEQTAARDVATKSSRNVLTPLQPKVVLDRIDPLSVHIPGRNLGLHNSTQMTGRVQRELNSEESNNDRLNNVENLNEMGYPLRPVSRVRDLPVRNVQKTMRPENSSVLREIQASNKPRSERSAIINSHLTVSNISGPRITRAAAAQTPARGNNLNQSAIVKVTRSGRAVRAPQSFW